MLRRNWQTIRGFADSSCAKFGLQQGFANDQPYF